MEESHPSAAAAGGGPPLQSIEVDKTAAAASAAPTALPSGQSTPTTMLTATTASTAANLGLAGGVASGSGAGANAGNLPPTVPYRSAGSLDSESPAAVLSAIHHQAQGGAASVSTISPGSLAGNNAVQFTARDASQLSTPDLGPGMSTPNPSAHSNGGHNNNNNGNASARPNLSITTPSADNADRSIDPSSSISPTTGNSRPSPRSAALRSNLQTSRSTLNASLSSYYQTQNTHLESAFGALMQSIQEHTEELDVQQDNLDRWVK